MSRPEPRRCWAGQPAELAPARSRKPLTQPITRLPVSAYWGLPVPSTGSGGSGGGQPAALPYFTHSSALGYSRLLARVGTDCIFANGAFISAYLDKTANFPLRSYGFSVSGGTTWGQHVTRP